ncbi:hypothetical protein SS50377_23638 [Spironucleus salmonicida]|nr:hypothetical protein SS50377_23628 [Spironucleus salmonicida]KAH0573703.1 hypothetical protein SS50377_23638 [Spironucleus salmonicida]|eukprot:EST48621.1 Hypothetical protein SS50377_11233 [Spironucleus salmonicida]
MISNEPTQLPQIPATMSGRPRAKDKKSPEDSFPAEMSQRVPFTLPKTVSPTRYSLREPEVNRSIPMSTMSRRSTFVDSAIARGQKLPGPSSYHTVSFAVQRPRVNRTVVTPQTRDLQISMQSTTRTEFSGRQAVEGSFKFLARTVGAADFRSVAERFVPPAIGTAEFPGDVVQGFKNSRSRSAQLTLNSTERFQAPREEPTRRQKGLRWWDY